MALFDSGAGWAGGPNPDPAAEVWLQATPQFLGSSLKELQSRWPTKKMVKWESDSEKPERCELKALGSISPNLDLSKLLNS